MYKMNMLHINPKTREQSCSICDWTNTSLLNIGDPGTPRWVCHGCVKRVFDAAAELARVQACVK